MAGGSPEGGGGGAPGGGGPGQQRLLLVSFNKLMFCCSVGGVGSERERLFLFGEG